MKIALAKATATAMPVSLKLEPGVDTQTLCTHAYNTAIEALNGTRSALDPESVDRAATLLQRARQVFFFGQGGSYILACDIWARFSMLPPSSARQATATCRPSPPAFDGSRGRRGLCLLLRRNAGYDGHAASGQGERCQGHPAHPLQRRPRRSAGRCRASVRRPKKACSTPAACRSSWPSSLWRTSSSCATRWTIRSLPTSPLSRTSRALGSKLL